jgi:hypothetical protein
MSKGFPFSSATLQRKEVRPFDRLRTNGGFDVDESASTKAFMYG